VAKSISQDRVLGHFGKVFSAVGILLLGVAAWIAQDNIRFMERAARVEGEVVDVVRVQGVTTGRQSRRSSAWYPVIAYTPQGGSLITKRSNIGSSPPSYDKGDKLTVMYEPSAPEDFQIDSPVSIWMSTFVLGFIGFLAASIGLVMVWVVRRGVGKSTTPH